MKKVRNVIALKNKVLFAQLSCTTAIAMSKAQSLSQSFTDLFHVPV